MKIRNLLLGATVSSVALGMGHASVAADSFTEAVTGGKASGDIRIRYESVDTDVVIDDIAVPTSSSGLTARTRLGYATGSLGGFSAYGEFEDVRDMFGIDDEDSLIPDPEVTEIEQAFIQYKNDLTTTKVGRQVITLDGHRHIGHVGWRQDRQTFDAVRVQLTPIDKLAIDLGHIYQRNRIFGETLDAVSNDFFANVGFSTPVGKITGYGYLLDDESRNEASDTFGFSFAGKMGSDTLKWLYHIEFATQEINDDGAEFETEYSFVEGGASFSGITAKIGYEVLGSDDGMASFTTPLATLHKFNGWADVFLGGTFNPTGMPNGLEDTYLFAGTTLAGIKLAAFYHMFSASEGDGDYGSEIDFVATKGFGKHYSAGFKYANFSADDASTFSDVEKVWVWVGMTF